MSIFGSRYLVTQAIDEESIRKKDMISLVRDAFGIKPLFYVHQKDYICLDNFVYNENSGWVVAYNRFTAYTFNHVCYGI
jgi:hypothetical protein